MNLNRTCLAVLGIVGLALLLAGCGGLFSPARYDNPAPIVPGESTVIPGLDPRFLGEGLIQPGFEYEPDRIIVGILDNSEGSGALAEIMKLVGQRIVDQEALGEIRVVEIDLKDDLDVAQALGMVVLLASGKLDYLEPAPLPEKKLPPPPRPAPNWRRDEPLTGIAFAEPAYIIKPPEPVPPENMDVKSLEPKRVYDPDANLRPYQWALDALEAEGAWLSATGSDVKVAVIDTGIDSYHPDLSGQVLAHYDPRTATEYSPPYDWTPIHPTVSAHGTHCAGIIAAKNDGKGIVGLAYGAKLLDVNIFLPGTTSLHVARGIKWAVDKGAKVLSNSWGYTFAVYVQVVKAALDYALFKGSIPVFSAGNPYNTLWCTPASWPGIIAVAASTPHGTKAAFSTIGDWLSVSAPGVGVLSTVHGRIIQGETGTPSLYEYWGGTSMACPYVAALCAMILEKHPGASPYQVRKLIESTAKDLEAPGFDNRTGYGLIQPRRALTSPLPPNDGAALRIHVVTASSMAWGIPWPTVYMDVTLRRGGRIVTRGQTDRDGWLNIGFPVGDYAYGQGLGYFPVLEPGTYEVIVGGDDVTPVWGYYRTANRVTAMTTVTLPSGGTHTIDVSVNTVLRLTLTWSGGGADTDIDLAVEEPGVGWTYAWWPGPGELGLLTNLARVAQRLTR